MKDENQDMGVMDYTANRISADYAEQRISRVQQQEPNGCVAATLAMMLRTDYWSAAAMLRPHADCYSSIALQNVLYDHGWAKCPIGRKREDGTEREQYPPQPFAPIHRVSVKLDPNSGLYHSILWLHDGTILDPMTETPPAKLADYPHVGCIEGWIKLERAP